MAEIRITYNPEAIQNVSELNGLKGKNLVANEIYANEDWIGTDANGNNPTDHDVTGVEFLNFAKHIDTNEDNKITDVEINNWRESNKGVGNSAHSSFSDEEVVELFGMVIDQTNAQTGKNNAGQIYQTKAGKSNANYDDGYNFMYDRSSPETFVTQDYEAWANSVDKSRIKSYNLSFSNVNPIEVEDGDKEVDATYDEVKLSSASTDKINGTLEQLKGSNLVVQNIYAHEEWLDGNEHDGKATNKNVDFKISGSELASFAKHIDQNNDGNITYEEFEKWRDENIAVGNTAHTHFTYGQVQEIFNSTKQ